VSASGSEASAERSSPARSPFVAVFTSHWLAMLGLGLVLTGIVMWACLIPAQLRHGENNPYVGLATAAAAGVVRNLMNT